VPERHLPAIPQSLPWAYSDARAARPLANGRHRRVDRRNGRVQQPHRGGSRGRRHMALPPVEIRHIELRRAWLRGYGKSGVDRLLNEIADSFESVWRERADLADRLDEVR